MCTIPGYLHFLNFCLGKAKQMPLTANQLRRALKTKHPYIERNLNSVVSIIRISIQNAASFEEACKYLKEKRMESVSLNFSVSFSFLYLTNITVRACIMAR